MQNAALTQHLILLEERLAAIEAALVRVESPSALSLVAARLTSIDTKLADRVPLAEVRAAIEDVFATYGLVAQLKEVYDSQRNQLTILVGLATQLISDTREGDQEINDLLIQLRELGRKHVRGLADLEHAADWHEREAEKRAGG